MKLGQKIYDLRKAKNLSQGDLADMLDVSRQSISKWETDASVPELDKLIKISEIFGISLDSLVKNENVIGECSPDSISANTQNTESLQSSQTKKIIGVILICAGIFAFLTFTVIGGILSGLFFSSPFILCGIICLIFRKRVGLWCAWTVYFLVDMYLTYATGISRGQVLLTLMWTSEMNFNILYFSWASLILLAALIFATIISFRKYIMKPNAKKITSIAILLLITVIIGVICHFTGNMISKSMENREYSSMRNVIFYWKSLSFLSDWLKISTFTTAIVNIIGYLRYRKQIRSN